MVIVKCKPASAGRRFVVRTVNQKLYKGVPYAPLLEKKFESGGHNNNGRIATRHIGGGHGQHYYLVGLRRNKGDIPVIVKHIEYDPNRTAHIALLKYTDGRRRYITAPKGVAAGNQLISGIGASTKTGNGIPLRNILVGNTAHGIELKSGKDVRIARSTGASAQLAAREDAYITLRLRSGKVRKVLAEYRATLGEISDSGHNLRSLSKADAMRWRGVRLTIRGVVVNPVDHPHGGSEGRTSTGHHPVLPWGPQAKDKKARPDKRTDNIVVCRRK